MERVTCDYSTVLNCWVAVATRKGARGSFAGYGFSAVSKDAARRRAIADLIGGGEDVG